MKLFINNTKLFFVIFVGALSISAVTASKPLAQDFKQPKPSKPLTGDMDTSNYDPQDALDWQAARDIILQDVRLWQCSGIQDALQDAQQERNGKKEQILKMIFQSHLCHQFSASDLRNAYDEDLMKKRHQERINALQEKCTDKEVGEKRSACLKGLLQFSLIYQKDGETLRAELLHGGTTIAKQSADQKNNNL